MKIAGPTLMSNVNSDLRSFYQQLFQPETSEVQEFSFSERKTSLGTCTIGRGETFRKKVLEFLGLLPEFKKHGAFFARQFKNIPACDSGLKVDWENNLPTQITLYFRIPSIENITLFPPEFTSSALAHLSTIKDPYCYAIRVGPGPSPLFTSYIELNSLKLEFESQVSKLVQNLDWSIAMRQVIINDARQISPAHFSGCIGLEHSGKVIKLDFAGMGLGRVCGFLRSKGVPEGRLEALVSSARRLNQIQTNYFALKYGPEGFLGWKVYFAVLESHQVPIFK